MDQDERVNSDSEGRIQNCTVMKEFDTGEGEILDLCHNDSWVTSLGAPAGWVHGRCPVTCGLCVPNVTSGGGSGSTRSSGSEAASMGRVLDSMLSSADEEASSAKLRKNIFGASRASRRLLDDVSGEGSGSGSGSGPGGGDIRGSGSGPGGGDIRDYCSCGHLVTSATTCQELMPGEREGEREM